MADRQIAREQQSRPSKEEKRIDRMEVNPEAWVETVEGYDELFGEVVGSASSIKQAAQEVRNRVLEIRSTD